MRKTRGGFTLVELLVVIAIMLVLISLLIPTTRRAREQAARVRCSGNLRQIGMTEQMYATDNRGWLFIRANHHPGTVDALVRTPVMALTLAEQMPAKIWYCPQQYKRGTGEQLSDEDQVNGLKAHVVGYAFYGAWWTGTAIGTSQPAYGAFAKHANPRAFRMNQLRSSTVRAGEWFEPYTFSGSRYHGLPSHPNSDGTMAGGNYLLADGSVHWSTRKLQYTTYFYVMPEN